MPAGLLGQRLSADDVPGVGVQGVEQSDGQAAAGAHAGAGRDVADGGDLQGLVDLDELHRLADQLVLDLVDGGGGLGAGVSDADRRLEPSVDGDVHVVVDGGAEHGSGLASVEGRQVGAAAGEADPVRGLRDDHLTTIPSSDRLSGFFPGGPSILRFKLFSIARFGVKAIIIPGAERAFDQHGELGRLECAVVPKGDAIGATRPMRSRSWADAARASRIAAARPSTDPAGTSHPQTSGTTSSGIPATKVVMTGRPRARASMRTTGRPSAKLGNTRARPSEDLLAHGLGPLPAGEPDLIP